MYALVTTEFFRGEFYTQTRFIESFEEAYRLALDEASDYIAQTYPVLLASSNKKEKIKDGYIQEVEDRDLILEQLKNRKEYAYKCDARITSVNFLSICDDYKDYAFNASIKEVA